MSAKIIIYGGTGGIGSAVASILNQSGRAIHLVARDEDRLAEASDKFGATYTVGDVTSADLFDRVADDAGDVIAGVVYAVGTINLKSLQRLSDDDYINDFRINALGAAKAVNTSARAMKKYDGTASVVLYSSVAASQGFSLHSSTGMVKGAVNGLVLSLAAELAPRIRVNAVAPTLTRTPLAAGVLANEKMTEALSKAHPLGRLAEPEDIAQMTAFLLSSDSDFITGQIMGIDGGRSSLRR